MLNEAGGGGALPSCPTPPSLRRPAEPLRGTCPRSCPIRGSRGIIACPRGLMWVRKAGGYSVQGGAPHLSCPWATRGRQQARIRPCVAARALDSGQPPSTSKKHDGRQRALWQCNGQLRASIGAAGLDQLPAPHCHGRAAGTLPSPPRPQRRGVTGQLLKCHDHGRPCLHENWPRPRECACCGPGSACPRPRPPPYKAPAEVRHPPCGPPPRSARASGWKLQRPALLPAFVRETRQTSGKSTARAWQEHGKGTARAWQEHGRSEATTWPRPGNRGQPTKT